MTLIRTRRAKKPYAFVILLLAGFHILDLYGRISLLARREGRNGENEICSNRRLLEVARWPLYDGKYYSDMEKRKIQTETK